MSENAEAPLSQIGVDGIALRADEQAFLVEECEALLEEIPAGASRTTYEALSDAVAGGSVPHEQTDTLQRMLEVGLESGRIRSVYGAHSEMAAARLYFRLPRGRALKGSVEAANEALAVLRDHPLTEASIQVRGPGSYLLQIDTGNRRVTLSLSRSGVSIENVEAVV